MSVVVLSYVKVPEPEVATPPFTSSVPDAVKELPL
jgi:hypothetical protein